jgi:hypothetical protein
VSIRSQHATHTAPKQYNLSWAPWGLVCLLQFITAMETGVAANGNFLRQQFVLVCYRNRVLPSTMERR